MAQVHFHCSDSVGRLLDRRIADVENLFEACDYAESVARSLISNPDLQDWRTCRLRVWDEFGQEIFEIPFSSVVGRPH